MGVGDHCVDHDKNVGCLAEFTKSIALLQKDIEYLRRETGLSIRQVFPDSFDDFIRRTGEGKIDISFANPFIYIKVNARYGMQAFARIVELDGRENFRGQIICRDRDLSRHRHGAGG